MYTFEVLTYFFPCYLCLSVAQAKVRLREKSACYSGWCLCDLREKSFKLAWWPKGFFVQPAKTGTVTWEQLVVMFFPLTQL